MDGTLPDQVLYTCLVQDLKLIVIGLSLLGNTLAQCEAPSACVTLGKQIGLTSNLEYSYFLKCMKQLGHQSGDNLKKFISVMLHERPVLLAVKKYLDIMTYLTCESRSCGQLITFLCAGENIPWMGSLRHGQ